ncbi:MAG: type II secretion system major pseudopilin GspG [Bdellovibrionales bacterium]|nr:type II secretion system major pseudopilin GspG [Bdellovibrionales bacterium]
MNQKGFSLLEILVALTLIALGGAFVMGKYFDNLQEGYVKSTGIQIANFKTLLEDFRRHCNQYPTTAQGLDALVTKPSVAPECPNYPPSGIMNTNKVPMDPWGRPYNYESDGTKVLIWSLARDGKEGGEGFDKDIRSDEL